MKRFSIILIHFLLCLFFSTTINAQTCDNPVIDSLGFALQDQIYEYNNADFDHLFDLEYLCNRFFYHNPNETFIEEYNQSFLEGVKKGFDFNKIVYTLIETGYDYNYVKCYEDEKNNYHLIFRAHSDEEGLNYHDFELKEINGDYKIVDVYIMLSGENFSQTFKRIYSVDLLEKLKNGKGHNYQGTNFNDYKKLLDIKSLREQGRYEEALYEYESLDEEVQKEKIFMIFNLLVCSKLSDELYLKALNDYLSAFPGDPSVFLISIDYYLLKNNFKEAYKMVDSLDAKLGGDTFLDLYRGNISYADGNLELAKEKFEALANNYPNYIVSYDGLFTIYAENGNYDLAVNILEIFVDRFGYTKDGLVDFVQSDFAGFAASSEFNVWKEKE